MIYGCASGNLFTVGSPPNSSLPPIRSLLLLPHRLARATRPAIVCPQRLHHVECKCYAKLNGNVAVAGAILGGHFMYILIFPACSVAHFCCPTIRRLNIDLWMCVREFVYSRVLSKLFPTTDSFTFATSASSRTCNTPSHRVPEAVTSC